jgi:hypothetical protein
VVLPFRHRAATAPLLLTGDQCESLLHEALGRWSGVQMVDPLWVSDARSRRGNAASLKDGVAIARERRAGRVVMGEVWQFQDTIYVRALLYDAAGSQRLVREQHEQRVLARADDEHRGRDRQRVRPEVERGADGRGENGDVITLSFTAVNQLNASELKKILILCVATLHSKSQKGFAIFHCKRGS